MALVLKPEFNVSIADMENMEKEFLDLSMERDQLIYHESELLKAEYMEKIGALEYKLYEFQVQFLRLKRKLAIVQQKINRQEKIVMENIEYMLDAEYEKYEHEMTIRLEAINEALKIAAGGLMNDEEAKELKAVYKTLVKRLHPDMNPGLTREYLELFYKAVAAYKNSDLHELRIIEMLTERISDKNMLSESERKARYSKLRIACDDIRKEMIAIRSAFPFDKKDFLSSPKAVAKRKAEIETSMADYKAGYAEMELKLERLVA